MGRTLIITEKPSVAQDFAKVLGVTKKGTGYIENDKYVIAWCVGHLVTMSYPQVYDNKYEKWNIEDLPFIPQRYKYEVIKDVAPQYKVLKNFMNSEDISTILYAGDSGREGEYIGRLVRMLAGVRKGIEEKRVWIDSQTEEEIKRGIREAKPLSEYDALSDAAYERAIEDYLTGINFTRALSCKYGKRYNDMIKGSGWKPLTVGRVMTCVTGMVVFREREIRNFKVTDYYRVLTDINNVAVEWKTQEKSSVNGSPVLYNEKGFKRESDAQSFIKTLPNQLTITDTKKSQEKKGAPALYNLAELQNDCTKIFKISPDKTLEVAQSLYEKKLTTYPRTDARVLSTAVANEINKNINGLKKYPGAISSFAEDILARGSWKGISKLSYYTNDSKITDHYAIIPTGDVSSAGALSELEKKIYELITKRFLAIFYPSAVYTKINLECTAYNTPNEETFYASVKFISEPGYMVVSGIPEKDPEAKKELAKTLLSFNKGDVYNVGYYTEKSETQPPKRYTSGSMILAMENAGNLIEEEELRAQIRGAGIGTSATRADVLKKLVKIGYLKLDAKSQVLTPLDAGEVLYDIVNDVLPELLSPKMTASWEKGLEQIQKGEITRQKYEDTINTYVRNGVEKIKKGAGIKTTVSPSATGSGSTGKDVKCPLCGAPARRTKVGYGCTKWKADKTGCNFTLWESTPFGKKLSESQMESLLTKGVTGLIKGFKKKDGSGTYNAKLKIVVVNDGANKTTKLEFVNNPIPKGRGL